jgi:hypothetical protein
VQSLSQPQPHCVTDLKYCTVAQWDCGDHLEYIPLYTHPQPTSKPMTEEQAATAPLLEKIAELEKANAAFFQRQDWWNRKMVSLEQELDVVRKDAERYLVCLKWVKGYITRYDPPGLPNHLAFGIEAAMQKETP